MNDLITVREQTWQWLQACRHKFRISQTILSSALGIWDQIIHAKYLNDQQVLQLQCFHNRPSLSHQGQQGQQNQPMYQPIQIVHEKWSMTTCSEIGMASLMSAMAFHDQTLDKPKMYKVLLNMNRTQFGLKHDSSMIPLKNVYLCVESHIQLILASLSERPVWEYIYDFLKESIYKFWQNEPQSVSNLNQFFSLSVEAIWNTFVTFMKHPCTCGVHPITCACYFLTAVKSHLFRFNDPQVTVYHLQSLLAESKGCSTGSSTENEWLFESLIYQPKQFITRGSYGAIYEYPFDRNHILKESSHGSLAVALRELVATRKFAPHLITKVDFSYRKYFEMFRNMKPDNYFQKALHLAFEMPRAQCDLFHALKSSWTQFWTDDVLIDVSWQLINQLHNIHHQKYAHRDLTSPNILVMQNASLHKTSSFSFIESTSSTANTNFSSENNSNNNSTNSINSIHSQPGRKLRVPTVSEYKTNECSLPDTQDQTRPVVVQLADFGMARSMSEANYSNMTCTVCAAIYRAPEVFLMPSHEHRPLYTIHPFAADIWSLGVVLLELWTGKIFTCAHSSIRHQKCEALINQLYEQYQFKTKPGKNVVSRGSQYQWNQGSCTSTLDSLFRATSSKSSSANLASLSGVAGSGCLVNSASSVSSALPAMQTPGTVSESVAVEALSSLCSASSASSSSTLPTLCTLPVSSTVSSTLDTKTKESQPGQFLQKTTPKPEESEAYKKLKQMCPNIDKVNGCNICSQVFLLLHPSSIGELLNQISNIYARDMISKMLQWEPALRPSASRLFNHVLFDNCIRVKNKIQ